MTDYIDAVVFGFILSFSFGPIFFILLETSITRGIKQALFMDFGVIISDLLFFSIAYFGASKIATEESVNATAPQREQNMANVREKPRRIYDMFL